MSRLGNFLGGSAILTVPLEIGSSFWLQTAEGPKIGCLIGANFAGRRRHFPRSVEALEARNCGGSTEAWTYVTAKAKAFLPFAGSPKIIAIIFAKNGKVAEYHIHD